jgi:hypothetical protein
MKITNFQWDGKKEIEGVWVDEAEGLRLLIARENNPKYRKLQMSLMRKNARFLQNNRGEDKIEEIQVGLIAETILLGWENLQEGDGSEIVYSKDKAYELLRSYPDFREMVTAHAQNADLFRLEEREEQAGN